MSMTASTIDPYLAAQKLRQALHSLKINGAGPTVGTTASQLRAAHRDTLGRRIEVIEAQVNAIVVEMETIRTGVTARKTKEPLERLNMIGLCLGHISNACSRMKADITLIPKAPAVGKQHPITAQIDQMFKWAQALPTQKDIPVTDAENTLRAIIALLRNHKWPGIEKVTQVPEKEVENGKEGAAAEALATIAATVGGPAPVGSSPGQLTQSEYDELDHEDESDDDD